MFSFSDIAFLFKTMLHVTEMKSSDAFESEHGAGFRVRAVTFFSAARIETGWRTYA